MEYILLFFAGILSSMHCLGMCSCFVAAYSLKLKGNSLQKTLSHLLYNLGRITTYSLIGAFMGIIGSSLYFIAKMANLQNFITFTAGCIMIYLGFSLAGIIPKIRIIDKSGDFFLKYTQHFFQKLIIKKGNFFTYPLGVTLGFLPCCLLYTVEVQAITTGNPLKGALTMFFFGLGTIPSLLSFGLVVNFVNTRTKEKLLKYASVIIILLGVNSIYRAVFL